MVKKVICLAFSFLIFIVPSSFSQEAPLVVHEWGTITTKHANTGSPTGYLNIIRPQEALPDFVHHLDSKLTELKAFSKGLANSEQSGEPKNMGHPDVTMRLETPVIYFYPTDKFDINQSITVDVEFKGGLINEYYPDAQVSYENLENYSETLTKLTRNTIGRLKWENLTIGGPWPGPETDMSVWLAPRQVQSKDIKAANNESERYLFYRGVAHLNNVFKTDHDVAAKTGHIVNPDTIEYTSDTTVAVSSLWIVSVKDKTAAFRRLPAVELSREPEKVLSTFDANFADSEYSEANLNQIRQEMKEALVKDGLYNEEAEAMLNTWQEAYFHNPGTRIFFLVPKAWINYYLPLKFSVPVQLERVMIGRIDLMI